MIRIMNLEIPVTSALPIHSATYCSIYKLYRVRGRFSVQRVKHTLSGIAVTYWSDHFLVRKNSHPVETENLRHILLLQIIHPSP